MPTFYHSMLLFFLMIAPLHAGTIRLSLSDVLHAGEETAALEKLDQEIRDDLEALLAELDNRTVGEGLVFEYSERGTVLEEGCNYTAKIASIDARLQVGDGSSLVFQLDSLSDANQFMFNLDLTIDASGRIQQKLGRKVFGRCYALARDNFNFTLSGSARLHLGAWLDLQLETVAEGLQLSPVVDVYAQLDALEYRVEVDGALLEHLTESELKAGIEKALDPEEITAQADKVERQLQQEITDALGAETLTLDTADLDISQRAALEQFIHSDLAGKTTQDYIQENRPSLLHALLSDNPVYLRDFATAVASCGLMQNAWVNQPVTTVFQEIEGQCRAVDSQQVSASAELYTDEACTRKFLFSPMRWVDYCSETLDSRRLGNASIPQSPGSSWQQSPGTRLAFSVASIDAYHQPWMTRRNYKKVDAGAGTCALEMRIYKQDIAATGLKPMMAFHGGSWSSRVLGFVGLESMISHYTEAGYAVFVPFYRLTDTKEGTTACHGVTGVEIGEDVNDALAWVSQHAAEFGATGPVSLFGQSAGAYLALSLAYHHPQQVANALLMYPPTDFARMIEQIHSGELPPKTRQGQKAIEQFLGRSLAESSVTDTDVIANSLPSLINITPQNMPPLFIIHGAADEVVPVDQSLRLCRALSGQLGSDGELLRLDRSPLRQKIQCSENGSQLHIIEQGDHALDACLFSLICPAGDTQSQQVVADSMREARRWLATHTRNLPESVKVLAEAAEAAPETGQSGGGSSGLFFVWVWLLFKNDWLRGR